MYEIKLNAGEGKRILGLVDPATKKITWLTMRPGMKTLVPDKLGALVKDKRFTAKRIETKVNPNTKTEKKGSESK